MVSSEDKVRSILEAGDVDVDTRNMLKETPLHLSTRLLPSLAVASLLVEANADVNAVDSARDTPLMNASANGATDVVQLLLAAHASVNASNKNGETPLHKASRNAHFDVAHLLLEAGADVHAKDNRGREPIHSVLEKAILNDRTHAMKTLQALVSHGVVWGPQCDQMVTTGNGRQDAPAFGACVKYWVGQHTRRQPFTELPIEVVRQGPDAVQSYIDQLHSSNEIVFRRKICVVGPGHAGKTSLVKSLVAMTPSLEHSDERTIGIDQFPLTLQDRVTSSLKPRTHEVTFWDFAGQDAYQVAHSLFFSRRTLFLICVDLEAYSLAYLQAALMADNQKQVEQLMDDFVETSILRWVRIIFARQPKAEFVFIATKEGILAVNATVKEEVKRDVLSTVWLLGALVHDMRANLEKKSRTNASKLLSYSFHMYRMQNASAKPPLTASGVVFVDCSKQESVEEAKCSVQAAITTSQRCFEMPDNYSLALKTIVALREEAARNDMTLRIRDVFAPADHTLRHLASVLGTSVAACKDILRILHDLGDVLWYEDLDVVYFQDTVVLDPMILIDFVRQVVNHTNKVDVLLHGDLQGFQFWSSLHDAHQMLAMKEVLQRFQLVHPASGEMRWDSDLIVPAFWKSKTPASWLFGGEQVLLGTRYDHPEEATRVWWEYVFTNGYPDTLFDQLVVASYSPFFNRSAGPDWILYKEQGRFACRVMVSRHLTTHQRTIRLEAVLAEAATESDTSTLWETFDRLNDTFIGVLHRYPGLSVSTSAWKDMVRKSSLKALLSHVLSASCSTWMPPPKTWEQCKRRAEKVNAFS